MVGWGTGGITLAPISSTFPIQAHSCSFDGRSVPPIGFHLQERDFTGFCTAFCAAAFLPLAFLLLINDPRDNGWAH